MNTQQALAAVGIPYSPGQPTMLRDHSEGWQDLADHLAYQQVKLVELLSQSKERWRDEAADTLHSWATTLVTNGDHVLARQVAHTQREHADSQERAQTIIEDLAVQIAITIAFIAAAAFFPALLAIAEIELALLAATAGRLVRVLAELLSTLVRFLVRARQAIDAFSKLSLRSETFALGYGRLAADAARDFTIELLANVTTSMTLKKPIDPGKLFVSATVSFGVGGLFGGLEASGVHKVLNSAGEVTRTADGKPVFTSFGDQYKKAVNSIGRPSGDPARTGRQPAEATAPARSPGEAAWREYQAAADAARPMGDRTGPEVRRTLLARAKARHRLALDRSPGAGFLSAAEARVRGAADELRAAVDKHAQAGREAAGLQRLRDVYRGKGRPGWVTDAEGRLAVAEERRAELERQVVAARAAHTEAEQHLAVTRVRSEEAAAEVSDSARAHRIVAENVAALERVSSAAASVRETSSLTERFTRNWESNVWRQGFGRSSGWREYVLYDGVKDFSKGFSGNLIHTGIAVGDGSKSISSLWKDSLLGGVGGAARGILKGRFANVAFPGGGLEEVAWKTGMKGMDKFVRDQLYPVIGSPLTTQ
ncbi:hypothetical protein ACIA8E_40930 [Streptomyces sp. NPDC051664]|uniref:hypothetical protein n=1 Tax=Streptomyces sp. NPDC051664 TaxID=3365668 RepID=UPI003790F428